MHYAPLVSPEVNDLVPFKQQFSKEMKLMVLYKKEMVVLQPLRWRCVDCVIHHGRDVREEQHHYICSANKQ